MDTTCIYEKPLRHKACRSDLRKALVSLVFRPSRTRMVVYTSLLDTSKHEKKTVRRNQLAVAGIYCLLLLPTGEGTDPNVGKPSRNQHK
jgi:hypothetical protein